MNLWAFLTLAPLMLGCVGTLIAGVREFYLDWKVDKECRKQVAEMVEQRIQDPEARAVEPKWENYDRHTNVVGYSWLDVENWR